MKIVVEGIPAPGREIRFGLGDPWAVEAVATSLDRPPVRLSGAFTLTRAKGGASGVVVVDVKAETMAPAPCDRCGEPCELAVATDTRLLYAPEETAGAEFDGLSLDQLRPGTDAPARSEVELEPEDLDLGWYSRGEISLGDVLCEALALATPTRVVCADRAECDKRTDLLLATAKVADGPFAVLGALKRGSSQDH